MSEKVNVLMVCLGNICRSPTAEGVLKAKLAQAGLADKVFVDSAGTGSWHIGNAPDKRATRAALARQYDLSEIRARQVTSEDFPRFDYIFAMDQQNLQDLFTMSEPHFHHRISLFLELGDGEEKEVPDPYYSGADGFEQVLDLIENAADNFIAELAEISTLSSNSPRQE